MDYDDIADSIPTFSKLLPASRKVGYCLTAQIHSRKVPDAHRPRSMDDPSSGDVEQLRTTELDDEMQTVLSTYTACIGDQSLPPSAQDMYRMVARMAAEVLSRSNEYSSELIQKVNSVRCMDRYIRETTLELNSARRDLVELDGDNRLFRFYAHLGDFAGALCNALKDTGKKQDSTLSAPWTKIVRELDKFDKKVADWIDQGQHGTCPGSVLRDAIELRVQELVEAGFDLDMDTALVAIRSYARRNLVSHGGAREHKVKSDESASTLVRYLDEADKTLESVLPDQQKHEVGKWRKLLKFFRDLHSRRDEKGDIMGNIPLREIERKLEDSAERSLQRSRLEYLQGFEMGKYRPDGLDGPPPNNVSWNPHSFRRHSGPEPRGTKRPAEEQLPERPFKRVRLAKFPDIRGENIMKDSLDDNAMGVHRLQLALYRRTSILGQYKPAKLTERLNDLARVMDREIVEARRKVVILEDKAARASKKTDRRAKKEGKGPS